MTGRRGAAVRLVLAAGTVSMLSCALPRWPVDAPLSSPFAARVLGGTADVHRGVDLLVPAGTEVRAMYRGRVKLAGSLQGYGLAVMLDHGDGLESLYAHLSEIRVQTGESIRDGAVIGLSGSSGNADGAHLHFEVWMGGRPVDPVRFFGGPPGESR